MNGCAPRLALRKRLKVIRKWPIASYTDVVFVGRFPHCVLVNTEITSLIACGKVFIQLGKLVEINVRGLVALKVRSNCINNIWCVTGTRESPLLLHEVK